MTETRRQTVANLAVFLLLAGAVWVAFGPAIAAPFFHDDRSSFLHNDTLHQLWPLSVPLQAPQDTPFAGRPLVNLSAALNYHFGQLDPAGYRLVNMALHLLSAMLLYGLVRRTLMLGKQSEPPAAGGSDNSATWLAFSVALLWAVHPLQTEAVCYATQRTELMMGLFYLATLYSSLRHWQAETRSGQMAWLASAVLMCLAGMASKEVMVSAPVAVLLYERTFFTHSFRKAFRQSWPLYLGLALTWILLVYLVWLGPRTKSAGFHHGLAPLTWWLTQTEVLMMYLRLAFWPWPLSIHYELPYLTSFGAAWPFVVSVALLAAGTLVGIWRGWASGFLGACFFMILSPTLMVPITTEVAAERRMYLPLAAVVILVVVGGYRLAVRIVASDRPTDQAKALRNKLDIAVALLTILLAVLLAAVSRTRLGDYRDHVSLWSSTVAHQPANATAHYNLGIALKEVGRLQEATRHYEQAVKLHPDDAEFHNNYGNALRTLGRHQEAVEQFELAISLHPDMRAAHYNLGLTLASMGDEKEAIAQFERLLKLHPNDVEALVALGNEFFKTRSFEQAIVHFERAVTLEPDRIDARINLGAALLEAGRTQEAVAELQKVVWLAPDSATGHFNLADAYATAGNTDEALAHARRALELARTQKDSALVDQIESWLSSHRPAE